MNFISRWPPENYCEFKIRILLLQIRKLRSGSIFWDIFFSYFWAIFFEKNFHLLRKFSIFWENFLFAWEQFLFFEKNFHLLRKFSFFFWGKFLFFEKNFLFFVKNFLFFEKNFLFFEKIFYFLRKIYFMSHPFWSIFYRQNIKNYYILNFFA